MSWSFVAQASGWSDAPSFSPTWPSGLQDGDVLVLCLGIAPDSGGQTVAASSPGWTQSAQGARFAWARYSAALALPTITTTGSPTTTWRMAAWRPAQASSSGAQVHQDGSPPAATSVTATTQTLLVLFGWAVGDQPAQWVFEGASWVALASVSGQGSGDANFANVGVAWAQAAPGDALTGLRAKLVSNRYFLLSVGERAGGLFFGA